MSITGYRQIMEVDTAASLPMVSVPGDVGYAWDTNRHYMFSGSSWVTIPNDRELIRYCDSGVFKNGTPVTGDIIVFTDSVTTSGGSATFYPTHNRTSTGNSLCSYISGDSFQPNYRDTTGVYTPGAVTVAANIKSISQTFGKQAFVGLVVLGLNVLGSVSNPAIPDGVTVKASWWGIAV